MIGVLSSVQNNSGSPAPAPDYNVVSLLKFNAANGSTAITDESGKVWTTHGNAQISTAQSKFGGSSLLLDGSGDYITTPDSADFDITGDFTIECWIRLNTGGRNVIIEKYLGSSNGFSFDIGPSTELRGVFSTGSFEAFVGATSLTTGVWHHVALTKEGVNVKVFLNGAIEASGSLSGTVANTAAGLSLGRDRAASPRDFDGYIDSFRWIKGDAIYTSAFTPPSSDF